MDAQTLEATLSTLQAEIASLKSRQISSRPRPALPDLKKFNGQTHKFDTQLPSIKAKLRVDSAAIRDFIVCFYYVYFNFESYVQAIVLLQLGYAEDTQQWDYNTILEQLARVYDNSNKIQEAKDKLLAIGQGTDSLPAYIAKFERLLYEAGGQDWPEATKISSFRKGLSEKLRLRLFQQLNLSRTYSGFVRVVQQLAGGGRSVMFTLTSGPFHINQPRSFNH